MIKDDIDFNFTIIVDIFYLNELKQLVLYTIDEATRF